MSNKKSQFYFICQEEEDNQLIIKTKDEVDGDIRNSEIEEQDLTFKVIGKISQDRLTIDFDSDSIEWYEDTEKEKAFIDEAVLKIIQRLMGKQ